MAQVKIYGLKKNLKVIQTQLSQIIHETIVKELSFPTEKKYHRFIAFSDEDMLFSDVKSSNYTIIEIMMMEGRAKETKKRLITALFENIHTELKILKTDIEICIIESPACNWGFSGMNSEDIKLNYKVNV
ncbi:tautomerase family protein [Sulfurimonas sp. SAG-AH-194-C20]|nr:tautomerase family protein [Sulfurimonas sp. SAG-AH-194-C20]MDF1878147.1 tautomerase family protein [Sulfurimonas sp. SAG-AH-194-C20]